MAHDEAQERTKEVATSQIGQILPHGSVPSPASQEREQRQDTEQGLENGSDRSLEVI